MLCCGGGGDGDGDAGSDGRRITSVPQVPCAAVVVMVVVVVISLVHLVCYRLADLKSIAQNGGGELHCIANLPLSLSLWCSHLLPIEP